MRSFIILFIACVCFSCDDFVDVQPKGKLIPEKVSDLSELLNDKQQIKKGISNTVFMTDNVQIPEDFQAGIPDFKRRMYTWQDHIYQFPIVDKDYVDMYRTIYVCNYVLERIDDAEQSTNVVDREEVKSTALLNRAFNLFFLVNMYAKHWDEVSAATDLGIAMPETSDINVLHSRATVKEVYDRIIKDIQAGMENLPDVPGKQEYSYKPSKAGAYGLLARIYLYQGKYKEAYDNASSALGLYNTMYNLNEEDYPFQYFQFKDVVWLKQKWVPETFSFHLSDELYGLFSADDARKKLFIKEGGMDVYFEEDLTCTISGIQVPELYLIQAEAASWQNQDEQSRTALKELMKNRYETMPDVDVLAGEDLLKFVLEERRRELRFDSHRWFDLKRLNKTKFKKTITRMYDGDSYTIEPNSNLYALPIPEVEINKNPNMEQNPR